MGEVPISGTHIIPVSPGALKPQLLVSAGFYGNELVEFVGVIVLALAIVGVGSGLMKRKTITVMLVIWVGVIFIFFSSLPNTWPRVLLPLIVPLAILTSQGILSTATCIIRLAHAFGFRIHRKIRLNIIIKVCFVILVVLVQLYTSIPGAITNVHSGYREAAEFLAATIPNRVIYYNCQPVLLVYTNSFGLASQMVGDIGLLNQSSAVVIDFIATLSPDYPKIQARISRMTLAARISNDIPINMLDSTNFSGLRLFKADPDRMTIRIYLGSPTSRTPAS
ncbi:MAG TPA: hypothetical protein VJZ75_10755 [Candidatus Bathyarchaeia archaeon]|nr:hypothetical protein [Candidatus Bathyarchaeia archaeon]